MKYRKQKGWLIARIGRRDPRHITFRISSSMGVANDKARELGGRLVTQAPFEHMDRANPHWR